MIGQTDEPSIGLFRLREFRANNNQIQVIPDDFFFLSSLRKLDLSSNFISHLSSDVELLFELTELILANNRLDSLPEEAIGNLECLETINISNNQVKELPPLPPYLVVLDLENNRLIDLPDLHKLSYVSELYLSGNPLLSLPATVYTLTSLTKLYTAEIGLKQLSTEIKNLVELDELDMSVNHLTHIPDEIGCLSSLQWLSIHHNKLQTLPLTLENLEELELVDASANHFSVLPPVCITLSNNGVELDLKENPLPKAICDALLPNP